MIIGITGLARSGKDTTADYLTKKFVMTHLDFARDALFAEADKRKTPKDKMSLSVLGDELRKESGRGVLAKIIASKMEEGKDYVVTGFRSPEEVDIIRNSFVDDFFLVEISAEKLTRYGRKKADDPQSMNEFFERDTRDIHNKGLGDVLKMCDEKIENNGSLDELYLKLDETMKKLK